MSFLLVSSTNALSEPLNADPYHYSTDGDTLNIYKTAIVKNTLPALSSPDVRGLLGTAPSGALATTWGPETRLTFLPESLEVVNGSPYGCANGDTLVVAFGALDLNIGGVPYLMKSVDGGDTWSEPWCIMNPDTASTEGIFFMSLYQRRLVVAGHLFHNDHFFFHNLYSKTSTNLGQSWGPYNYFFNQDQQYFGKMGGGSSFDTLLFAFYHGEGHDSEPIDSIRSVVSMNNGLSWSSPRSVAYGNPDFYPFSVRYSQGRVHLLYPEYSPRTGLAEVYYVRSDDWGTSWTEPVAISDDSCEHSNWPYLSASEDGYLIASWFDYKYGWGPSLLTGDILYRISSDNGISWGPESRLTYNHYATGSFSYIKGNQIGLIWEDGRDDNFPWNLYYTESSDMGATWSDELRLTDAPGAYTMVNLVLSGDNLYMFWADARDDSNFTFQIYFRRAEVLVGIDEEGANNPGAIGIRAYPNPFNGNMIFENFTNQRDEGEIDIFDVTGRLIKSLMLKEGKSTWDATDNAGQKVCSGLYFARVETPQGKNIIKLSLIK